MNCREFQEEALLYFGQQELPEELADHLSRCPSCEAAFNNLKSLAESLPPDKAFYPDEQAVAEAVARVRKTIVATEISKRSGMARLGGLFSFKRGLRALPVAAAVALAISVSLVSYKYGQLGRDNLPAAAVDYQVQTDAVEEAYYDKPDEPTLNMLLHDLTSGGSYETAELLLGDITEEEFEYLEANLQIGDIL